MIPSAKLSAIFTVRTLLANLVKPPKPRKLAEEIQASGELESLSNITVYDRRITPVDKQKMVGRWKVIVEELEKRNMPVTGYGNLGTYVEKKWLSAGQYALRKVKAEKMRAKKQNR